MTNKQFYLLSFTWGLIMTVIGLISALVLICTGHKPKAYGRCLHFTVGENWGGVSLGIVIITDTTPTDHTLRHEHGHALQNVKYGVAFPFIVAIPSFIRYWVREIQYRSGHPPKTDYDAIWFEKEATELGTEYVTKWNIEV